MRHARPHLEVHSRSKGHSAVAGVAYRLGLKLWDERAECWHDYTRRSAGEEVVMATTLAPDGAPAWAMDPAALWNAVEASEIRKDGQVARDYRIPVPFGLTDAQAGDLALGLARFIVHELSTPVSVGLHRDAAVDALGQVKPDHLQGYHAHLYFPTRPLLIDPDGSAGGDREGASFGPKHAALATKRVGSQLVERFNAEWARQANAAASIHGLTPDYDHRSYVRMGVPITPQPTLGAGATALERKGFFTRKGDTVRDIVVASKVYEKAHAAAIEAQHAQALRDVEWTDLPDEGSDADHRVNGSTTDTLARRFEQVAPTPATVEARDLRSHIVRFLHVLERALGRLGSLVALFQEHADNLDVRTRSRGTDEVELEKARRWRSSVKAKLSSYEAGHRFRMSFVKAMKGKDGRPKGWTTRSNEVEMAQHRVDQLKRVIGLHDEALAKLSSDELALREQEKEALDSVRTTLAAIEKIEAGALAPLLSVLSPEQQELVRPMLPQSETADVLGITPSAPAEPQPARRLRPML